MFSLAKPRESMGPAHHSESMAILIKPHSIIKIRILLLYVSKGYLKKVLYGWLGKNWPSSQCMDAFDEAPDPETCISLCDLEKVS